MTQSCYLGRAYHDLKQLNECKQTLQRALDLKPCPNSRTTPSAHSRIAQNLRHGNPVMPIFLFIYNYLRHHGAGYFAAAVSETITAFQKIRQHQSVVAL
jgi:hypothetical protein